MICHGGQGQATTVAEAHHSERAGEDPILPTRYIESGCGQCHQNALLGTPQLNLGRTMLTRYGCVHCHAITRPDGLKVVATDHPPSLVHIADKTTREWILQLAQGSAGLRGIDDDAQLQTERRDASDISAYLMEHQRAASRRYHRAQRQAPSNCRSRRGSKPLRRILLRLLPRGTERGG